MRCLFALATVGNSFKVRHFVLHISNTFCQKWTFRPQTGCNPTGAKWSSGIRQRCAQFLLAPGSQRLKRRQRQVQQWVANLLKLKAEIIAEHFTPDVLQQMTGEQITPEVMQILKTDKLRSYRVNVETDSTVFEDAEEEKATRSALIGAVSQFITAWGPIVGSSPPLAPVAFELLKFGLGAFKSVRGIEDAIEQAAGQLQQEALQPKPPSPEEQKMQLEQQKAQQEGQLKQQDAQLKMQIEQQKLEIEKQKAALELQLEREKLQLEREKMGMERQKMQMEIRAEAVRIKLQARAERTKASLEERKAKAGVANDREKLRLQRDAAKNKDAA
jgi:hypothetical protein